MKKLVAYLIIALAGYTAYGQADELAGPSPYFSALIVKDMDASISWYMEMLGYEVVDQKNLKEMKFRQANLKRGASALELIELGSAIDPADVVDGYNAKTKLHGIFKIGFTVVDFDQWLAYLQSANAEFHGDVVADPVTGNRMVIVKDPDGNRIQLFERK